MSINSCTRLFVYRFFISLKDLFGLVFNSPVIFSHRMDISPSDLEAIIRECYDNTIDNDGGMVADYIPQLASVNPDLYGVSFCDVNGRILNIGDTQQSFCLQSAMKPLSYCLARENETEAGATVHEHVGYEPSGRAFNEFVLNRHGLPHNPLINAGAIMVSSLIKPKAEQADRFETVQKFFTKLGKSNLKFLYSLCWLLV